MQESKRQFSSCHQLDWLHGFVKLARRDKFTILKPISQRRTARNPLHLTAFVFSASLLKESYLNRQIIYTFDRRLIEKSGGIGYQPE
jgi:hypothetical protein